jgi:hypothetical protein
MGGRGLVVGVDEDAAATGFYVCQSAVIIP